MQTTFKPSTATEPAPAKDSSEHAGMYIQGSAFSLSAVDARTGTLTTQVLERAQEYSGLKALNGQPDEYPAPVCVRNTFVDYITGRPPSIDGFFQERQVQSCPASRLGSGCDEDADILPASSQTTTYASPDSSAASDAELTPRCRDIVRQRGGPVQIDLESVALEAPMEHPQSPEGWLAARFAAPTGGYMAMDIAAGTAPSAGPYSVAACPQTAFSESQHPYFMEGLFHAQTMPAYAVAQPGDPDGGAASLGSAALHLQAAAAPYPGFMYAMDAAMEFQMQAFEQGHVFPGLQPFQEQDAGHGEQPGLPEGACALLDAARVPVEAATSAAGPEAQAPAMGPRMVLQLSAAIDEPQPIPQEQVLPSMGSAAHEAGRCKPCAFLHTKGCANAIDCPFCHLCGPGEKKKRRKDKVESQRSLRKLRQAVSRTMGFGGSSTV